MQLTLVRHGEAEVAILGNDEKRQLTDLGRQQAEKTAKYLKEIIQPEVFVVSPLVRAQETLRYISQYFPNVPIVVCNTIKPEDDPKVAIEWLSHLPYESIVVVCHMNVIAHMASLMTATEFHPYALAEARVYEQQVLAAGLSTHMKSFIPKV